jgi:hypothetical protein
LTTVQPELLQLQVASAGQTMVQLPPAQLPMLQVAPGAQVTVQAPPVQSPMLQAPPPGAGSAQLTEQPIPPHSSMRHRP